MKKFFLIKIFLLIFVVMSFSQNNMILIENGYYVGEYLDTTNIDCVFYLYMKYVNKNEDESQLIVLPYKHKKKSSKIIMKQTVKNKLTYLSSVDDLESVGILDYDWAIKGFDNFPYITISDSTLSFSLNIADFETGNIEVFNFIGKVTKDNKIDAIIDSDKKTFNNIKIKFNFIND